MGFWILAIGRCFLCLLDELSAGLSFHRSSTQAPDRARSKTAPGSAEPWPGPETENRCKVA